MRKPYITLLPGPVPVGRGGKCCPGSRVQKYAKQKRIELRSVREGKKLTHCTALESSRRFEARPELRKKLSLNGGANIVSSVVLSPQTPQPYFFGTSK